MDEPIIVAEFLAGSPEAFAELVRQHQLAIRWRISRLVSDPGTVDDLAQDVFVELLRARREKSWVPPNSLAAWLQGVARNKAVDHLRRHAHRVAAVGQLRDRQSHPKSWELAESDEASAGDSLSALQHCLQRLQSKHREIIDEFYGQEKSSELIAARLGMANGAVRMLLFRIRQALGKCIRKRLKVSE